MGIDTTLYEHESLVDHSIRMHKQLASDREHRSEIMSLVNDLNALRDRYVNACLDRDMCAAARDEAFEIMRENQDKLPNRALINARINNRMDKAREDYLTSLKKGSR